jgi:hypothetical protein
VSGEAFPVGTIGAVSFPCFLPLLNSVGVLLTASFVCFFLAMCYLMFKHIRKFCLLLLALSSFVLRPFLASHALSSCAVSLYLCRWLTFLHSFT